MGFRRNIGTTRICRINDGYIEFPESTVKYRTSIPISTDWQCNLWEATPVVFLFIDDDDNLYVGTDTGSVGKYGPDGLVKALYTWEPPEDTAELCGYYNDRGIIHEVRIFENEPKVLNVVGSRRSFILTEDVKPVLYDTADDIAAYILRTAVNKQTGIHVVLEGGERVDECKQGYWNVDPNLSSIPVIQF